MKIYMVSGEAGHYEEHHTWGVAAFLSEKNAEEFVKQVSELSARIFLQPLWDKETGKTLKRDFNHLDPDMDQYDANSYYVEEVDFLFFLDPGVLSTL